MKNELLELGCTETESVIYIYLIEHGKRTPAIISRDTGIKRPTVYAALAEMIRKRIITEEITGSQKMYYAKPGDLDNIVSRMKNELTHAESVINKLSPQLLEISRNQNIDIPRIEYIRQEDLVDFLKKQSPIWNDNMILRGETSWWGYNSDTLLEEKGYREWIDWYWKTCPAAIELHLFSAENSGEKAVAKNNYRRRYMKYWSDAPAASQWVLGDYIIYCVTDKKPHYAIQIHDRMMAESARRTFRKLWNSSN